MTETKGTTHTRWGEEIRSISAERPDFVLADDVVIVNDPPTAGRFSAHDIDWASVKSFRLLADHAHYLMWNDPPGLPTQRIIDPEKEARHADMVNHPPHYRKHPSGVECIQITEHMSFCLGSAMKYLWRHEHKGGVEDLKKAAFYINREIERLENESDD